MKQDGIFIIGTDTDVGKTFVTSLLGALAKDDGYHVGMVKPVASGAIPCSQGTLESIDATTMMNAVGIPESRRGEVNTIALPGEFSPRLAAELAGVTINYPDLVNHIAMVVAQYDLTFVEGAGGITTPLTSDKTFTDLGRDVNLPTLLIADGRLGSINRVILTWAYGLSQGIEIKGIIVNNTINVDEFLLDTNVKDMEHYTGLPVLGVLPPYDGPDDWAVRTEWARQYIDSQAIWNRLLEKGSESNEI